MKTAARKPNRSANVYRHYRRRYPNAADPQYFIDRLVDGLLALAAGIGSLTIFVYLITM